MNEGAYEARLLEVECVTRVANRHDVTVSNGCETTLSVELKVFVNLFLKAVSPVQDQRGPLVGALSFETINLLLILVNCLQMAQPGTILGVQIIHQGAL